jgi:hypothetical protein
MPDAQHAGSVTHSSWPLVQESCNQLGVSYQGAQAYLIAAGYPVGPTDRLPFAVVAEALQDAEREHLARV